MSVGYHLINLDKREEVSSTARLHIGTTFSEITGNQVFGSVLSFYMMTHMGDRVSFINDREEEFYLFGSRYVWEDFHDFKNVTEEIVAELIADQTIRDEGIEWIDQEDDMYFRKLALAVHTEPIPARDPNFS